MCQLVMSQPNYGDGKQWKNTEDGVYSKTHSENSGLIDLPTQKQTDVTATQRGRDGGKKAEFKKRIPKGMDVYGKRKY